MNDVHSRLNPSEVAEYHEPQTKREIEILVLRAKELGLGVSISGGRHAMGGQQFGSGTLHINLSKFNRILSLDRERGWVTVESGVQWPELIQWLINKQADQNHPWGIRQKQTGADKLTLGGALSANVHGRGLTLKPIVDDIISFELVNAQGQTVRCSRQENRELFSLAIGGYGLFGVITEITLRLAPRTKLERKVEIVRLADVPHLVEQRIREGYLYGDFQFKTDEKAEDFMKTGVFSFYKPVSMDTVIEPGQRELTDESWAEIYKLGHLDKSKAFHNYASHYLSTNGQIYWSDTHQLSSYVEGLDEVIDKAVGAKAPGSLMISEFYVPRPRLPEFLLKAGKRIIEDKANLVYGTVRYIEKEDETFLPWARSSLACIVMNLRVAHDAAGMEAAQRQFQNLMDIALSMDGGYFLTYQRWARKDQVLKAYPMFPEFLRLKLKHDPDERFQSDWYRHYKPMFAE